MYNKTFAKKIKAEIDKLLEANFIYTIEHMEWVSPIVVPKIASVHQYQKGECCINKGSISLTNHKTSIEKSSKK